MAAEDYARATDSTQTVEIDGKSWQVSRLTPRDMGDLQQFLREQIPNPRLLARDLCAGMSDEVAKHIWDDLNEEYRTWPPSFGTAEANRHLLHTLEGNARLLWVVLRRTHRNVDLERARELALDVDLEKINEVVSKALPEYARDPKARTPETAAAKE